MQYALSCMNEGHTKARSSFTDTDVFSYPRESLGRPLSEARELWRAAPETALRWGAEEFGFPDPVGVDSVIGDVWQWITLPIATCELRVCGFEGLASSGSAGRWLCVRVRVHVRVLIV